MDKLFDINKLPAEEGILVFPISMSRISNSQNAKKCWEHLKIFSPGKIIKPLVGVNFIYTDYLYFNSEERSSVLKNNFMTQILTHKNEFLKILKKNPMYIAKAFSFTTWNQMVLECKEFTVYLGKVRKLYGKDKIFQKYVKEDTETIGRTLDENQLNFFLEEIVISYLIAKGKIRLHNDYVQDHERWVLWCYPGKPLRAQIYFFQKKFFKLKNLKNRYENAMYDLEKKKLHDFTKIILKE